MKLLKKLKNSVKKRAAGDPLPEAVQVPDMVPQFEGEVQLSETATLVEAEVEAPAEQDNTNNLSENTNYWTRHNVTLHLNFKSREESLDYLHWRNSQYLFYDELMPVSGLDDKVIVDYGCGPGNDLVGFIEYSNPKQVVGMDVSSVSLVEARNRLKLHENGHKVQLSLVDDGFDCVLPMPDESVDYVHCSGVLMILPNMDQVLQEFHRILKPKGRARVMIYNYDSLWLHLYVAYTLQLVQGVDTELDLLEAFRRSTDGPDCPISRCYTAEQFIGLTKKLGFKTKHIGNSMSAFELSLVNQRFAALMDRRLPREQREFLKSLTFDNKGQALYNGEVAGIDSVYEMVKR